MADTNAIEAAARAFCCPYRFGLPCPNSDVASLHCRANADSARTAILAFLDAAREPTPDMKLAGGRALNAAELPSWHAEAVWKAMWAELRKSVEG